MLATRLAVSVLATTIAFSEGFRGAHNLITTNTNQDQRGELESDWRWWRVMHRGLHLHHGWLGHRSLKYLTRYASIDDEEQFPLLRPRTLKLTVRVEACMDDLCREKDPNVRPRFASPFEHVCGGARGVRDIKKGHDGPTQWLSFSNAVKYPDIARDCNQTWDKGQRRMSVSERSVLKNGGLVVDLSDEDKAWKWCWEGGQRTTVNGKTYNFEGAKTIKPWPYKCATTAFRVSESNYSGQASESWWNGPGNRELIAKRCMKWALDAREVLILPDPSKIEAGNPNNEILVENDRWPAHEICSDGLEDRCIFFDRQKGTVTCSGGVKTNMGTTSTRSASSRKSNRRFSRRSMKNSKRLSSRDISSRSSRPPRYTPRTEAAPEANAATIHGSARISRSTRPLRAPLEATTAAPRNMSRRSGSSLPKVTVEPPKPRVAEGSRRRHRRHKGRRRGRQNTQALSTGKINTSVGRNTARVYYVKLAE